jgi:manganese/zinc/iron transport system permease protein
VVVSTIFTISILFSPGRGVLARWLRHHRQRDRITQENILKALLKPGLANKNWSEFFSIRDLQEMWSFPRRELSTGLKKLTRQGMIESSDLRFRLTPEGVTEGARVLRLHRLWELYLTHHLELSADHVHRDAEDLEHVITPEMEQELQELLDRPQVDPHDQEIPYLGEESGR